MDFTNIDTIRKNLLSITDTQKVTILSDLLENLLAGATILLVNDSKEALVINSKKWESRSIQEPETENVVRGAREGFNENVTVGLSLLRRKIKDPDLCIEKFKIGDKSKTEVYITYLKNIANPKMIEERSEYD